MSLFARTVARSAASLKSFAPRGARQFSIERPSMHRDKLVPTEVYPLISAVTVVSGFAFYSMGASLKHEGHNLRLMPQRYEKKPEREPWERE